MEGMDQPAHFVDANLGEVLLGFLVPDAPQQKHIGLRQRADAAGDGGVLERRQRDRRFRSRRGPVRMREQETRETPGERRFADPFRPADHHRLRKPVAAIGVEQLPLGRLMAEQARGFARMRGVGETVALRRGLDLGLHAVALRAATVASGRKKRASTICQMACATSGSGASASTTQQRPGSLEAISR